MTTIYQTIFPNQYISKFLLNNIRQDARTLTQYRPITIESDPLPQCNTSSRVTIGNTKVLCGVTYELGLPSIFSQREGQIHIKINTLSLAGKHIASMHSRERSDETEELRHRLLDLIKAQKLLNLTNLYITDKCVWNVYIDIHIISHDGNTWDAIILAFQHAIKLTEIKYFKNIKFLPLEKLKERETLFFQRQKREEILKSTQENYRSTTAPLPPPTNNHIIIPKLEVDLTKICKDDDVREVGGGGLINKVGVLNFDHDDDIQDKDTKKEENTLERPAEYTKLLFPPIILNKMLYPTQIAIIPVQEVKMPEKKNNDENSIEKKENFFSPTDVIPNTLKQTKPFITTRKVFVLDPSWTESEAAESIITVIFDEMGQICLTQKTSGTTIGPSSLIKCLEVAAQNSGRISKLIKGYLDGIDQKINQKNDTINSNGMIKKNIFLKNLENLTLR